MKIRIERLGVLNSNSGMALVLTLMVLALITAMITEFACGVYTETNALQNWYNLQKLSLFADSGITMGKEFIFSRAADTNYTYPGVFSREIKGLSEDFDLRVNIKAEDENSKFNMNTLVYSNGTVNEKAFDSFKRLLSLLSLDTALADYVVDWIDPDSEERRRGSEIEVKNTQLYSVDELLRIKGIDRESYEILEPYVTVYGNGLININGAEKPVLMSLADEITDELAQRIVDYRNSMPFEFVSQLQKVSGFDLALYGPISSRITVKGKYFHIKSLAEAAGLSRMTEAVVGVDRDIKYWKEN